MSENVGEGVDEKQRTVQKVCVQLVVVTARKQLLPFIEFSEFCVLYRSLCVLMSLMPMAARMLRANKHQTNWVESFCFVAVRVFAPACFVGLACMSVVIALPH